MGAERLLTAGEATAERLLGSCRGLGEARIGECGIGRLREACIEAGIRLGSGREIGVGKTIVRRFEVAEDGIRETLYPE